MVRLETEMAILLDFEKLALASNPGLFTSRRLLQPCEIILKSVMVMIVLLHITANNLLPLFNYMTKETVSAWKRGSACHA